MAQPVPGGTRGRDPGPAPGASATVLVDDAGQVTGWSPGMVRLLGYRAGEVVGRPVHALMVRVGPETHATAVPDDAPEAAWLRPLATSGCVRQVGTGGTWSCVLQARHEDGAAVPVAVEVTPLTGPGGATQWLMSLAALTITGTAPGDGLTLLRALMERSPLAIALWDTDLRCIWMNATAAEVGGVHDRGAGRPLDEAVTLGFDLSGIGPAMRSVLDDGRPVIDLEVRRALRDGTERALSASVFRLEGPDGAPQGLCTVGIDVSDSSARQRLALLNSAGTRIGTTLDIMTTAQELADVTVPALADFASVDLADWIPLGEVPRERPGFSAFARRPAFRRAGLASIRAGVPETVFPLGEVISLSSSSPIAQPLLTGRAYFEPVIDMQHFWLNRDPVRAAVMRRAGMHSGMVVPLKARGTILGFAVLTRMDNPAPFTRDDLLLAEELAARAALSLDNARQYSRERNTALALQRDLLPHRLSGGAWLDVTSRYLPTDKHEGVGGDWYDVIPLTRDRIALVVGDVVGHGINAAAAMGRLRTAVHTLAALDLAPDRLLDQLDRVALKLSEEADEGDPSGIPNLAATCVYAVYDPATQMCTLARAGHPPPAIVTPEGRTSFLETPTGGPVGWGLGAYESVGVRLPEGSKIALFTDGLIETRRDDIDTGLARLAAALHHEGGSLDECCAHVVRSMLRSDTPEDDVSLLLARTRAPRLWPVVPGGVLVTGRRRPGERRPRP